MKRLFFILSLVATGFCSYAQNVLRVYPAPDGVEMKNDFTVKARVPGGEWQDVPTYMVKVDEVRDARHCVEKASLSYFDFEGQVEVSVTSNAGLIQTGKVRPLSYGIEPVVEGNMMTFMLDCPRNLSVEVNGDIFHNLHLFANSLDVNNPIDGVRIKNEKQIDYQGCMAINAGDENLIRNILFEDIRIEDITFRNVSYNGSGDEMSVIYGYSEDRKVKNIRFENLVINGQVISDDMPGKPKWYKTGDMCRFLVGEHVENIQFVK